MLDLEKQHGMALLCDDMGLGKTTVVLAEAIQHTAWPTLILVPNALVVQNWVDEIRAVISGSAKVLHYCTVKEMKATTARSWYPVHFVIMTYQALVQDAAFQKVTFPVTQLLLMKGSHR